MRGVRDQADGLVVKEREDLAHQALMEPKQVSAVPAVHPVAVLREQRKWTRDEPSYFIKGPLQQVIEVIPRPSPAALDLHLAAYGVKQATRKMLNKACGPDQWHAADLLRLPASFWQALADITNAALCHGVLPRTWSSAVVVLLPKTDTKTRPSGLCQIVWRAGARCLAYQLRG